MKDRYHAHRESQLRKEEACVKTKVIHKHLEGPWCRNQRMAWMYTICLQFGFAMLWRNWFLGGMSSAEVATYYEIGRAAQLFCLKLHFNLGLSAAMAYWLRDHLDVGLFSSNIEAIETFRGGMADLVSNSNCKGRLTQDTMSKTVSARGNTVFPVLNLIQLGTSDS